MEAMNQPEFSLRLLLQRVADALAISFPEPLLLGHAAHVLTHIFTSGDAESREQRIRLDGLTHAVAKILDGAWRTRVAADAILAFGSIEKCVPGEPINIHAAILCQSHDVAPKVNFLRDGQFLHHLVMRKQFRADKIPAAAIELRIQL